MSRLIILQWSLPKGVAAYSSTRIDGVSLPPYDSPNLGAHCGNNPDHVEEDCRRLFTMDNLPSKPTWLEQVHDKDVLKPAGESYVSKRTDTSYSSTPDTVCAVMTVDCPPVLFCNRTETEVAAAHVGWCGLCAGVLEETISCFVDNPGNILAWSGPTTGPRVFEVGVEVRGVFMAVDTKTGVAFIQHGDEYLVDIYQLAWQCLASAGIEQVFGDGRCTYTENETFSSYRRGKTIGHAVSFIWLT